MTRKPYPTDVSDEEWAFVAPYLTLMTEAAPQRDHSLREVFNGVRWIVRTGGAWRLMPHDHKTKINLGGGMSESSLKILDQTFTSFHPRISSFDYPSSLDGDKASFP